VVKIMSAKPSSSWHRPRSDRSTFANLRNLRNLRSMQFSADENFANQLDAEDPLRSFRDQFHLPLGKDGKPLIYFAGNSLGLMPISARLVADQVWDDWV